MCSDSVGWPEPNSSRCDRQAVCSITLPCRSSVGSTTRSASPPPPRSMPGAATAAGSWAWATRPTGGAPRWLKGCGRCPCSSWQQVGGDAGAGRGQEAAAGWACLLHQRHICWAVLPSSCLLGPPLTPAGASHSVALTSNGFLFTWGSNDAGQLGLPHAAEVATQIQASRTASERKRVNRRVNQRFLSAMAEMGIPSDQAELALHETGNVGVEVATEWLFSVPQVGRQGPGVPARGGVHGSSSGRRKLCRSCGLLSGPLCAAGCAGDAPGGRAGHATGGGGCGARRRPRAGAQACGAAGGAQAWGTRALACREMKACQDTAAAASSLC